MAIEIIAVEGRSVAEYLRQTVTAYAPSLAELRTRVEDWGGINDIEARLEEAYSKGKEQTVFVVWDQDVLSRPGRVLPSGRVFDHPLSYTFPEDFEAAFPDWMIAAALKLIDKRFAFLSEADIGHIRQARGSRQPFYECLCAGIKAVFTERGGDPTTIRDPSKVKLAESLAAVANMLWYQPEAIRRLLERLQSLTGGTGTDGSLISEPVQIGRFDLNRAAVRQWDLKGRLLLSVLPDLWSVNLGDLTVERLVEGIVAGSACWSPDGSRIAFRSHPSQQIYNSEAIRVYDMNSGLGPERLRLGGNLCWDRDGLIYGNSLGWKHVTSLNPNTGRRRNLPLPEGSILASIDRRRHRILIGEQGRHQELGSRVCSLFRINDGQRVWDGASARLPLADWSAGAVSPDGQRISWPVEEASERSSLYITHVQDSSSQPLTPPDGRVQSSCWSPDGSKIAFMWSRWGDPIRLWVIDVNTRRLEPLIEGQFGGSELNALGCHSWAAG